MNVRLENRSFPWWTWILVINLMLVGATILYQHLPRESGLLLIEALFPFVSSLSLHHEMNLAVWWAGTLFLLAGLISYELFSLVEGRDRLIWLLFFVVFVGFSVDETSSAHERMFDNWALITVVMLAGISMLVPAFWRLINRNATRSSAIWLLVGLGLVASAAPQEYLEHNINWPQSLLGLRVGVEEGSEIMGTLICLVALVRQRGQLSWPNPISKVIPDPSRMRGILALMIGAFVAHVMAVWVTVTSIEIGYRGDPAVYIPTAIFVFMACWCFWRAYAKRGEHRWPWLFQTCLFGLASLSTIYLLSPNAFRFMDTTMRLYVLSATYFFTSLVFFLMVHDQYRRLKTGLFVLIVLVLLVTVFLLDQTISYIASGLVAVLMGGLTWRHHTVRKVHPASAKAGSDAHLSRGKLHQ